MKPVIKFSRPWNNKICCDIFTSIRPHNPNKYQEGRQYEMHVQLTKSVEKMPVKIYRIYTQKLVDIHEAIFLFDMAMSKEMAIKQIKEVYNQLDCDNALFDILILRYDFD